MAELLEHYQTMLRIRLFEEKLLALFREGRLRGTAHVCIGQEAIAAGACSVLGQGDFVTSNHRGHGHMIARGADVKKLMAELFGRESGYSRGCGGSQHIAATEIGFLGSNGITAGGIPIATGAGLTLQLRKKDAVCLCFMGDGATAQGTFHESLNLAAIWSLPVVYVCENNHYAMGTHVSQTCPVKNISDRALGFGIPGTTVDGNNPLAVEKAVSDARHRALAGKGPSLIEAVTWRIHGHSRSDQCHYRCNEEEARHEKLDPISVIGEELQQTGVNIDDVNAGLTEEIEAAVAFAEAAEFLPPQQFLDSVYPAPAAGVKPPPVTTEKKESSYAGALYDALDRALADESVVLLGEDIADYNGAFRVTRDLYRRYGEDRVRNTPISENTIVGAGVGAAMTGMRPVVEIMFMDFLLLALDQLVNHAAKFSAIYGPGVRVPLTVRTPAGGYRGYGATHSQCFESLLMSVPGLKVFCPATVQDAYDLLLAAIYDDGPVVVVEHKLLYGRKDVLDTAAAPLPPGTARIVREGGDLTIVSFSHMLGYALEAASLLSEQGISAGVIDLRTVEPLDFETVAQAACATQRVLIVEEGVRRAGVGAEIAARLQEECFGYLDAPVRRVGARSAPVPAAQHLEQAILPQVEGILHEAAALLE